MIVYTAVMMISLGLILGDPVFSDHSVKEYCERESFEAKCAEGEVIRMRYAQYGRMRMGRCVRNDYGAIGCSVDVLPRVEALCSGRRECAFPVTDLHVTKPCPNDLMAFMEASYICIKVSPCQHQMCDKGGYLRVASTSGYLASVVTSETGCGSTYCPWVIEPKAGQRLNLTFHIFFWPTDGVTAGKACHRYATVVDKGTKVSKDVTMCNNDNRQISMLTTLSSAVEIRFYVGDDTDSPPSFLLKYQVAGCPDILPPAGSTMSRDGDLLSVRCTESGRTWHLTCGDTDWVGEIGSCSEGQVWNIGSAIEEASTTPAGLILVVSFGVALGVLLGFTMLAVAIVYMKRRQSQGSYEGGDALMSQTSAGSGKLYDKHVSSEQSYRSYQSRGSLSRPNTRASGDESAVDATYPLPAYFPDVRHHGREHVYESPQTIIGHSPSVMRATADNANACRGSAAV